MMPIASSCQRWRDRRTSLRPAGELFDPSRAEVLAIDDDATAKAFVCRHHYAASYPAARARVGLFVKPHAFAAAELAGVAVFSVPMNERTVPAYFEDLAPRAGVELGRLVLLDEVAANGESWFIARALRILRRELPEVAGVVSYSDPLERTTDAGELVKPGHIGIVYQATNAAYRGRSSRRTLLLSADGRIVSQRAIAKLRNDERGAGYAYAQLLGMGAPARLPLESGADYVRRATAGFRRLPHPGNHAYTWRLDGRPHAADRQPYPKAIH